MELSLSSSRTLTERRTQLPFSVTKSVIAMKSLTSSTSSKFVVEMKRNCGFFTSAKRQHLLLLHRTGNCFLRSEKLANLGFSHYICTNYRAINPISSLSAKFQEDVQTSEDQDEDIYQSNTVRVKIQLQRECLFGEQFLIVGDDFIFGLWDPSNAIPLNWSEGHLWTVELDIPIGKSIQFKFILKGITGNILWQPGPDRIFQTWETTGVISVYEDWDGVESQKIMVELENQNAKPPVLTEQLIASEILTYPSEEVHNLNNNLIYSTEKTMVELSNEQNGVPPSGEKPKAIVAENISYSKENTANKEPPIADGILRNNGSAAIVNKLASTGIEESLINYEGDLVLVPGLAPIPTVTEEEATEDEVGKRYAFDEVFEAQDHKRPEITEKQDAEAATPEENAEMCNDDEEQLHEEESHCMKIEARTDLEPFDNTILQNEINWGQKTLQKFLTNLGLV